MNKPKRLPAVLDQASIAKLLGITPKHLSNLVRAGHIPKVARGEYDPVACATAYTDYVLNQGDTPRAGLLRARLKKLNLGNAKAEATLVTPNEVQNVARALVTQVLVQIEALENRLTSARPEMVDIVRSELQRFKDSLQGIAHDIKN